MKTLYDVKVIYKHPDRIVTELDDKIIKIFCDYGYKYDGSGFDFEEKQRELFFMKEE